MKKINVEVMSSEEALKRFERAWTKAKPDASAEPLTQTVASSIRMSSPSCMADMISGPTLSRIAIPASSNIPGPVFGYLPEMLGLALITATTLRSTSIRAQVESRSM